MPRTSLPALLVALAGCVPMVEVTPPTWNPANDAAEAEYAPYFAQGSGTLTGQAFLTQTGGGVVKAAGRTVTLDPATSVGDEWWAKAGKKWRLRSQVPPSPGFLKARREKVADADGRFNFAQLPPGRYYVRTEVTWEIGGYYPTQGGLVGQAIEVRDGETKEVIVNQFPQ